MNQTKEAMSVEEFCKSFSIGRTKVYEEIKERRLTAKKLGRKTIITKEAAQEWLSNLPEIGG